MWMWFLRIVGVAMQNKAKEDLLRKLQRIEALYHRPGSVGEKSAAAIAINRLKARLFAMESYSKQVEIRKYEFTVFKEI
jgi:hypothetical protein